MRALLQVFVVVPLVTSALILAFGRDRERLVSTMAIVSKMGLVVAYLVLIGMWSFVNKLAPIDCDFGEVYRSGEYAFPLVLYFDHVSAVFLGVTTFISAVIVRYSRYYLHNENGYGRFFSTIFLFIWGMNLLILSGTLDLLFAGWEAVGISSFLLIGFYRDRVQPVRNAMRTFAVYRFCDIGLLLGAWLSHLIWHKSQHFADLATAFGSGGHGIGGPELLGLSLLILLAALGKSAQFPFCFWLPRAMEGPTPSSAIFYGALSIHAGVFLLIRTADIWFALPPARIAVGVIGLLTAAFATFVGRSQSNIKGQIAYASITQVGLMLVELSLGWTGLVLVHFVSNACLRSYQLLISPSVVAHLLRVQGSAHEKLRVSDWSLELRLPRGLRNSFYALALHEGGVETLLRRLLWQPAQSLGRLIGKIDSSSLRWASAGGTILIGVGIYLGLAPGEPYIPVIVALMLAASLSALSETSSFLRAWNAAGFSATLAGIIVLLGDTGALIDVGVFWSGAVPAWICGSFVIRGYGRELAFDSYHGQIERRRVASYVLFFCMLVLVGFPLAPTFLGADLLLHHSVGEGLWVAVAIASASVVNSLALVRIFSRLCLGPTDQFSNVSINDRIRSPEMEYGK